MSRFAPVGLGGNAPRDFAQVSGNIGKFNAEPTDPVRKLVDQPFAV
jgi:hypothetical protein